MKRDRLYSIVAAAALALVAGPVAVAVFVLGFLRGDSPCVMCWAQRTLMVLVALVALFVLRFGPRPRYVGLGIIVSAIGIFMGIRHSALHMWRDVGQGFSAEILGAHTYTWSAFVFWVAAITMGALLLALRDGEATAAPRRLGMLERLTMGAFLVVVGANIVQAFASTGPPPFMGQGDPVRFSFNPAHWVWSLEEWRPSAVSLRGRWDVEKPSLDGVTPDHAAGPLADLPVITARRTLRLAATVDGPVTGFDHDPATDRFLVTTSHSVYIVDAGLETSLRQTTVDPGYSVDLGRFGAAAFVGPGTVMALGENKSFVVLRENDNADAAANFRYFLASFDRFDEERRSRFTTVRAKMMYVRSLAFDPESRSIYTLTVPNRRSRQLVVSRFDRGDLTLSEEFVPRLVEGSGVTLRGKDRSLGELYVTGAACHEGRLFAISAAFGTLLEIDPASRSVTGAWAIEDSGKPAGLAVRGEEIYIIGEDGHVTVTAMPENRIQ
ncbi:MAG: disulfide bond formation protein B [Vicinamibacterales bacterium]